MEVVVNSETKVSLSPRKIQPVQASIETIALNKLSDVPDFDIVTVSATVGKSSEKLRYIQDLAISDETGTPRLTLWQDTIDSFTIGTSYSLQDLQIRSF